MIDSYSRVLTIVTALGAGLNAGVFFAFSSFVMTALRRLPATQSISAMNAINKAAPTAWFMTAFVGTAIAGVVLAVSAFRRLGQPSSVYQLAGVALYLVAFAVTAAYHVPRKPRRPGPTTSADGWPGTMCARWPHLPARRA